MNYLRGTSHLVMLMDIPFGYTLTVWGAGMIAVDRYGAPSVPETATFVVGAIVAYLVFATLNLRQREYRGGAADRPTGMALFNATPVVTIAVAAGVVRLVAQPALGFALAGFAGTASYIAIMGAAWSLSRMD